MAGNNRIPQCRDFYLRKDLDCVDASVFSGDALCDAGTRANFRWYLERWGRKLEEFEEMAAEE